MNTLKCIFYTIVLSCEFVDFNGRFYISFSLCLSKYSVSLFYILSFISSMVDTQNVVYFITECLGSVIYHAKIKYNQTSMNRIIGFKHACAFHKFWHSKQTFYYQILLLSGYILAHVRLFQGLVYV